MKCMCEAFPCPLSQEDLKLWKALSLMWVLEASQEAQSTSTFVVDLMMAFCITIHNVMLLKTKLKTHFEWCITNETKYLKKKLYFTKSEANSSDGTSIWRWCLWCWYLRTVCRFWGWLLSWRSSGPPPYLSWSSQRQCACCPARANWREN